MSPLGQSRAAVDPEPSILARTFAVETVTHSKSNRIYLFKDSGAANPPAGKVILLKRESQPVMAFLVVKSYSETQQFAAKRVRDYGDAKALNPGETFTAVEKTGEAAALAPSTPQDLADLKEVEGAKTPPPNAPVAANPEGPPPLEEAPTAPLVPPGDTPGASPIEPNAVAAAPPAPGSNEPPPALDGAQDNAPGAPPDAAPPELEGAQTQAESAPEQTTAAPKIAPLSEEDYDDSRMVISVEETDTFNAHHQWLTGAIGMFRNYAADGENVSSFAGGGMRYGLKLGQQILMKGRKLQDALNLEAGLFYYKILSYEGDEDGFTVTPIVGSVRYDLFFSPNFGIFFYAGYVKNFAKSISPTSSEQSLELLNSAFTTAGAGLLFQLGPNWYTRVDLGTDFAGAGLMLSF